jgi:hypothetical protein
MRAMAGRSRPSDLRSNVLARRAVPATARSGSASSGCGPTPIAPPRSTPPNSPTTDPTPPASALAFLCPSLTKGMHLDRQLRAPRVAPTICALSAPNPNLRRPACPAGAQLGLLSSRFSPLGTAILREPVVVFVGSARRPKKDAAGSVTFRRIEDSHKSRLNP